MPPEHAHLPIAARPPAPPPARREPLPHGCLAPMLATLGAMPVDQRAFGYEVKWDGYRALARFDGAAFTLCSRNGLDLAPRFPEAGQLRTMLRSPLLLDGEIVALDHQGHALFSALQTRMPAGPEGGRSGRSWDPARFRIHYQIFDLLHLAGRSTRDWPYQARRAALERLQLSGPHWDTPPWHADGPALLRAMAAAGQEGILAKRLSSCYVLGTRTRDWIKIKLNQSDDFLVVGYWSSGKHGLSSLLLGCHASAAEARAHAPLRYCGKVGTGFGEADRERLLALLRPWRRRTPPCHGALPRDPGVVWCTPRLVVQIRFSTWTRDGALRQPAFLGLRSDQPAAAVIHPVGA